MHAQQTSDVALPSSNAEAQTMIPKRFAQHRRNPQQIAPVEMAPAQATPADPSISGNTGRWACSRDGFYSALARSFSIPEFGGERAFADQQQL